MAADFVGSKNLPESDSRCCHLQEAEQVMDTFNNHLHLPVTKVDDSDRVLTALKVSSRSDGGALALIE